MTELTQLHRLADYNRWMNQKVFGAAAQLDSEMLNQDLGAFFQSIIGTLNHIYTADCFWLRQIAGQPRASQALKNVSSLPRTKTIGEIVFNQVADLTQAREELDEMIIAWSREWEIADLTKDINYRAGPKEIFTDNFTAILQHFFNHQTHHRGQTTTLLTQCGIDVGATDLMAMVWEQKAS